MATYSSSSNNTSFILPYPPYYTNGSNENIYFMEGYPSGYTFLEVILISIIGILVMAVVIIGNFLVIISIFSDFTLQNVQNWFVASLALADLLLGVFVMPLTLAQEVLGYWIFGDILCQFHSALDVFLCTSSIINICLISLDRYWSITREVGGDSNDGIHFLHTL